MKIGELFVALGFKISGKDKLDDVPDKMDEIERSSKQLAGILDAVSVAILAMATTAGRAGMILRNFATTTGLSTDSLQYWQHANVVAGGTAEGLTSAIERLNDQRSSFMFGEPVAVGAWQMLGVNPLQDPFLVIHALRERLKGTSPLVAKGLLSRVGMDSIAPLLMAPQSQFEGWSKNFIISRDQVDRLADFAASWESIKMSVSALKNLFGAALAPALQITARALEWVADKASVFVNWLNSGSTAANIVRGLLGGLTIGILALAAVLTVATAAMFAFDLAAWGSGIPEIVIGVLLLAAAIDDIITSFRGGKSITREIGEWLAGFQMISEVIEHIWAIWDRFTEMFREGVALFEKLFSKLPPWMLGVGQPPPMFSQFMEAEVAASSRGGSMATATQTNNIHVHVDGHATEETGSKVGAKIGDSLAAAAWQFPVPNY